MNDWVTTGGKWYYCGESGAMVTSQMINGQYYVNINGAVSYTHLDVYKRQVPQADAYNGILFIYN